MSVTTFRAGDKVAAARMNLALREAAAVSGAEAAAGTVEEQVGVPLERFGVVSGGGDNTTLLNTAIANAAGEGWRLITGHRNLRIEGQPIFVDGLSLDARGTTFERRYSNGVTGWVVQPDRDSAIKIKVTGGRWWNPDPANIQGNSFDLHLEDSEMSRLIVDEWGYFARAFLIAGKRIRMDGIVAVSLGEGGGFRLNGVEDTIVSNCYCACGDDLFMFSTTGNPAGVYAGWHNRRSHYINCAGISYDARLCIAGAYLAGGSLVLTSETTDCSWTQIRGKGRLAAFIGNNMSSGVVARLTLRDVKVDCSEYAQAGAPAVDIRADAGTGGVQDILLDDVAVTGSYQETAWVQGACKRVVARDCYFGPPTTANWPLLVSNGADFSMRGGHVEGRTDIDVAKIGTTGTAPQFFADGVTFSNIGNSCDGIVFTAAARGAVTNCRFLPASGATTARAAIVASGCENLAIGANDYSAIPAAVKVSWPAAANAGCRIDVPAVRTTTAAATIRAYESGLTLVLTGATGRTFTLPPAGGGLRFRFVQQGAGVVRVQATSGDVIQIGASTSTVAGYADASAAGDVVDLVAIDDTTWLAQAVTGTWTVST